ncbi:MAG: hypothetical protein ACRDM0_02235 [Thermoleophilaceae bacterium]
MEAAKGRQRSRLSQEDVPSYSLEEAMRVPRAIAENGAYKPTKPLNVASGMKMTPGSGTFRGLTGAAIAYGLTTGGSFAPEIALTPLGMRVVRPTRVGDDLVAKREAVLRPKIIGEFLRQYDGAAFPTDQIAKNVLLDKGVPADRVDDVLALILASAETVGFLKDLNGKRYVDLAGATPSESEAESAHEPATLPALPQVTSIAPAKASPALNINIEIHIAADATSETIEEIFKNMRRYVLGKEEPSEA